MNLVQVKAVIYSWYFYLLLSGRSQRRSSALYLEEFIRMEWLEIYLEWINSHFYDRKISTADFPDMLQNTTHAENFKVVKSHAKKYVLISSKYDHIKISKLPFLLSQQCKRWEKRCIYFQSLYSYIGKRER